MSIRNALTIEETLFNWLITPPDDHLANIILPIKYLKLKLRWSSF